MFRNISVESRTTLRFTVKDVKENKTKKTQTMEHLCAVPMCLCVFERIPSMVTKSGTQLCRLFYGVDFVKIMPCTQKKEIYVFKRKITNPDRRKTKYVGHAR